MSDYTDRPEYKAHLAGVIADPADDVRRLVLCDWLEELETPEATARAEFIRVQLHLANLTSHYHNGNRECPECDQVNRWLGRESQLLREKAYGLPVENRIGHFSFYATAAEAQAAASAALIAWARGAHT